MSGVRNLVPDDRRQVVKTEFSAALLDRRVKRNYGVPPVVLPPREAHVADHADKAPARNERAEAMRPHLVQLFQKLIVVLDMPHLSVGLAVFLQGPIRRGGNHKMNALRCNIVHVACIAEIDRVHGGNFPNRLLDAPDERFILRNTGKVRLGVVQREHLFRQEVGEVPCRLLPSAF